MSVVQQSDPGPLPGACSSSGASSQHRLSISCLSSRLSGTTSTGESGTRFRLPTALPNAFALGSSRCSGTVALGITGDTGTGPAAAPGNPRRTIDDSNTFSCFYHSNRWNTCGGATSAVLVITARDPQAGTPPIATSGNHSGTCCQTDAGCDSDHRIKQSRPTSPSSIRAKAAHPLVGPAAFHHSAGSGCVCGDDHPRQAERGSLQTISAQGQAIKNPAGWAASGNRFGPGS